ncbi:MAG: hypothetical protein ABI878_02725 [Acidobacteriota bacterium]
MRVQSFLKYTATVLVGLILFGFAAAQEPKTVTDHLLALPNDLFKLVDENFEFAEPAPKTKAEMDKYRRSKILVEDIKNGYIEYDHNEFPTQIALFKKDGGGYLVAVSVRSLVHADKGQVCSGDLNFLEYDGSSWLNVTEKYEPKLNSVEAKKAKRLLSCYELPREGRSLRLYSLFWETEDTWGHFEWNGTNFVEK